MKRIITFMMALALICSLSVTAFAAEPGVITITNATVGETYSVYKIFDATYQGSAVTYTITTENPFFAKLFGADGKTANEYFEYHEETGVVTRNTDKTDAELFGYLAGLVAGVTATKTKEAAATTIDIDKLAPGYYVISRTNGTTNGVTITTAKPTAEVHDKNSLPGDLDKTTDKESAKVGDTINWELKVTASNYDDGKKVLNYTIWDNLSSDWAAIDTSTIKVFVNGTEISDWDLVSGSANGFKIDIPWVNTDGSFKYAPVVELKVTYSGTILNAAVANDPNAVENKNTADFEWDNETTPDVPGDGDETDTKVYNLGFTKVDGTNPTKTLAGAKFELYGSYNTETKEYSYPIKVKLVSEGLYIVDPEGATNTVISPADGQVVIQGLAEGTYYLTETKAPAGYNELTDPVEVTIAADPVDPITGEVTQKNGDEITVGGTKYYVNNAEVNIENFSGVELPSTGGEGTIMMISIGTMVAMVFAVLMITQKKMSIYQD